MKGWLLALFALSMLVGCQADDRQSDPSRNAGPRSIAGAECAVCGMIVSEQPAPRAQVVHRDGTRQSLCGVTDLLIHLDAASPHGAPVEIDVEVMEADEDPSELRFEAHEWASAETAVYRLGDRRPPLIMGDPVMVYRDRATAERAIARGPTELRDFAGLRAWWRERRLQSSSSRAQ